MLTSGSRIVLAAAKGKRTNVALIGGQPAQGPILFSGPFVMDKPERLSQAKRDYLAGQMGRLEGVPF
ncbi:MAG: pirin-like C-terminal cupin domain-containing protein [Reyranellales bacterium]